MPVWLACFYLVVLGMLETLGVRIETQEGERRRATFSPTRIIQYYILKGYCPYIFLSSKLAHEIVRLKSSCLVLERYFLVLIYKLDVLTLSKV